jgi:ribonucleoside-diphosphate reductase alpha subunit
MESEDNVVKRNGDIEVTSFDKIVNRIRRLGDGELEVNYTELAKKIIERLYDQIPTERIDELLAQQCASLCTTHHDYGTLASRVIISNHTKNTSDSFYDTMNQLYNFHDIHDKHSPLVSKAFMDDVASFMEDGEFKIPIDYDRDNLIDYFGFKTLERAYLMRTNGKIIERPQHMWMRVSIGIHGNNRELVEETYNLMSQKYFTHATPTLFNAGTPRPQLSSCYLIGMEDDSIQGIYSTLTDCAKISKWAGGIGMHIHNIRASGSHIRGTNGTSNGLVPMLRVFNNTARYVDQGGGKRSGSFAIYLEPWHKDIVSFLDMKKNHGDEDQRARDLFYALWIPDLFMKRVKEDGEWTLMCPDQCRGLSDVYGDKFEELYCKYEKVAPEEDKIRARDLWFKILDSQIETGTPYMLYKDACNKKSNQQNLGTIKSSNLCTEIIEYSDENQTAVCNLASIGLPKFVKNKIPEGPIKIYSKTNCKYCKRAKKMLSEMNVKFEETLLDDDEKRHEFYKTMKQSFNKDVNSVPQIFIDYKFIGGYSDFKKLVTPYFDYDLLHSVTKVAVNNLNKVIDVNFYPTNKTRLSNLLHRPIGLGIQGLADVFAMLDIPFHSDEAKKINVDIFETLYHAAVTQSKDIAKERMEGMHKLKLEYSANSWKFKDDNQVCQEYIIKDPSNIELYNELEKYKPIKPELTSCDKWNLIGSYSSFTGSPAHKGQLQYDLWNVTPSSRYDWNTLKFDIDQFGMRNSLLMAPMPTASTSQILGNNECFEPFTSNIYVRRTIAGEFVIINKHLIKELIELDKWSDANKNNIIANNGSVQSLDISDRLKRKYKTVWEIPMKHLLEMSADRGPFICQSQSTNLWMKEPDYKKLTAMHMFAWEKGLKTGIYYLRTRAKAAPQQFTIDPTANKNTKIEDDDEGCLMCSG